MLPSLQSYEQAPSTKPSDFSKAELYEAHPGSAYPPPADPHFAVTESVQPSVLKSAVLSPDQRLFFKTIAGFFVNSVNL